jgi:hypothetical protein
MKIINIHGVEVEVPYKRKWWFAEKKRWYVTIYNGRNRKISYAKYLMQIYLGRKLGPNEIVHHVNKIPTDDRIDNYEVLTRSQHQVVHQLLDQTIKERVNTINEKKLINYHKHSEEANRKLREKRKLKKLAFIALLQRLEKEQQL